MVEFIDKTQEKAGTPLNRANMMAVQGFEAKTTVFNSNGSITETNENGNVKTTTFSADGKTIVERFTGEKVITKTTTFNNDRSITEVIG